MPDELVAWEIFRDIVESEFRVDVSSTQLRQRQANDGRGAGSAR